jgi:sugar O-acyltransferase (sialic acid O-acetyltransferase NeuD family)
MKSVLIFGAGQVAEVMAGYLRRQTYDITAHVVDETYWEPGQFVGKIPVCAFEQVGRVTCIPTNEYQFVVGMSFKGLNAPRAEKYQAMLDRGFKPLTYRHGMTGCYAKSIGRGSFIMDLNIIQDGAEIGDNCILWSGNHIGHHTKIGNHVFIASHAVIGGACEIGDHCFIGVNATIRDNVKIGPRCVIGAGALILSDCEADGVYGAPATPRSKVPSYRLRGI